MSLSLLVRYNRLWRTVMRDIFIVAIASILVTNGSPFANADDAESLPSTPEFKGLATQQCVKDLFGFNDQLAEVGFGVLPPGGIDHTSRDAIDISNLTGTPRRKLRILWDAAYLYALAGDERSCQTVLTSMQKIFHEHQAVTQSAPAGQEKRTEWRRAHLGRSIPVSEMSHLMRADVFIGAELRNTDDEILGQIQDLVFDPERQAIQYVLVSRGGFAGFGKKLVAVRWRDLRATEDHKLYVLAVTPVVLEAAPIVGPTEFRATDGGEWRRKLDEYWERVFRK